MEQMPFGTDDFAENPEPRCPCVLLLDISGSMQGTPISELNAGLQTYREELCADSLAAKRVEVAVVTFGGQVQVAVDFQTASSFAPPVLHASGDTPMGAAIVQAIDLVTQRKQTYRTNGIAFYRPWIFLITDGGPTDAWHTAAQQIKDGEQREGVFVLCGWGSERPLRPALADRDPRAFTARRLAFSRSVPVALELPAVGVPVDAGRRGEIDKPRSARGLGRRVSAASSWRWVAASAIGTAHVRAGLPCQDSHAVFVVGEGDEQMLLLVCADGAGSATESQVGSRLTCDTIATELSRFYLQGGRISPGHARNRLRMDRLRPRRDFHTGRGPQCARP